MSRYLVDTVSWIDFSKRVEPQSSRLSAILQDLNHEVGTCDVIVAEFMSGVNPSERDVWRRFFATMAYWEIAFDAAALAGEDRYDLARRGQQVATPDALIAATARAYGAILITDNMKDFPQPDITIMSLR